MAPKKKPQKPTDKKSTSTSYSSSSSSKLGKVASSGPRLQISAENEGRLRRLLLNSGRPAQSEPDGGNAQELLSKAQKAKKLKAVYEKLSCEGFTNDQVELALSALKEGATFEAALDWLCLNLPGHELPSKFSSATSQPDAGGSVGIISVAREDWMPSVEPASHAKENVGELSVKAKRRLEENILDQCQPSQAEWIKQYLIQQEEEESNTWEDELDESFDEQAKIPRPYETVAKEYLDARSKAASAKEKGDKKSQEEASNMIQKLKQELLALGLTDEALASEFSHERVHVNVEDSLPLEVPQAMSFVAKQCTSTSPKCLDKASGCTNDKEPSVLKELWTESVLPHEPVCGKDGSEDVELGDFFLEDTTCTDVAPPEVLELQKKEKMRELCSEKNLEKLDGIWKKGDPKKIPKAILHQLCQRSGWEAPKFNKVVGKGTGFSYTVSVLRKASGRGKSRKAGGLTTIQLPEQHETFESTEDAQNKVAAFAICQLFPEVPVHLSMMEPYAFLVLQWKAGESLTNLEDGEEIRRASFVDVLLNAEGLSSKASNDIADGASQILQNFSAEEIKSPSYIDAGQRPEKVRSAKDAESFFLKQELGKKRKMPKYQEMSNTRGALPIAALKGDILQLLRENNVLVVCGETGSGKTTQVPQFILDDMIESGKGGYCNIICTQPRRIAAISVAERVADERCEGSPGSSGCLVGYQVRLDSARSEKTKLLFCTTGILLRKLAGDKSLTGITHVIVDEVHERSLLGDFLLIVLKNLIEKQSAQGKSSLKVILMSATVDSVLFSRYFGNCPVITAQGRTHPVATYFLEDIYESVNYRLASDSPACLGEVTSTRDMRASVNNSRGKKNLVLSSWGDESLLSEESVNPYYNSTEYESYSELIKQNLRRLNEDVIDYDLLEDLVSYVDETCDSGAILIFLPGVSEIYMLLDRLASSYRFGGQSSDWLLPLHSSIMPSDQKKVFLRPPENIRKVIVATNIAETSITIDDVVYVIDCGKHKENRYNPQKKLASMVEDWISRANVRQRSGRAGRVKPGTCFCLYTRYRFEKRMRQYQVPEMLRMPLVELCLQIKLLGLGSIKPFLLGALEPPKEEAITSAISLLYEVGAIEGNEDLTPLGHHLAKLPVDLLIGKMMLYGGIFGCLSPILSISAFLSYKSPFVYPKDEKQDVERAKLSLLTEKSDDPAKLNDVDMQSDHLVMMVAYRKWEKILREQGAKAAKQFCNSYFLSSSVMHMIRDMRIQFGTLLADIGFINLPKTYQVDGRKKENMDIWLSDYSQPFNMHSNQSAIVKAILCAGLYPNVAANEQGITEVVLNKLKQSSGPSKKSHVVWYDGRREVHIHPSSINSNVKVFQHPFLVFLEKVATNKVFLRDTTIVSPFSILLFGGSINIQHQSGSIIIDGWLKLTAPAQTAVLFKELRLALHSLLTDLIRKPENADIADNEVVKSMIHLLLEEDKTTQ